MADIESAPQPFPFPVDEVAGPSPLYAERRATCPMGRVRLSSGHDAVLLVTHRDVAAALADPRLSHDLTAPGSARINPGPSFLDSKTALLNQEGEAHLRTRRIVASAFTPRRVERWKPTIEAVATELLDGLEKHGSPADLVAEYSFPLPVRIICTLLGVPEKDHGRFRDWSNAFLQGAKMTLQRREELMREFAAYVMVLIAQRRAEPGNDLIDDLIAARDGEDKLTEQGLVEMCAGLIAAGNETTSNALGRAVLRLLDEDRVLWEQLRVRPDLLPAAVDELLRVSATGSGMLRIATEDVELPSGTVKAGESVVISFTSSQRDEVAYPDPDEVKFEREVPPPVTFGGGPHYCLGAHLAKAELRIGLGLLLQRLPDLRLAAAPEDLRYTEGDSISSLIELPVAW
jgi:cytochrome P450